MLQKHLVQNHHKTGPRNGPKTILVILPNRIKCQEKYWSFFNQKNGLSRLFSSNIAISITVIHDYLELQRLCFFHVHLIGWLFLIKCVSKWHFVYIFSGHRAGGRSVLKVSIGKLALLKTRHNALLCELQHPNFFDENFCWFNEDRLSTNFRDWHKGRRIEKFDEKPRPKNVKENCSWIFR